MAHVRLLSTDFDGTLIGHGSTGCCSGILAERLESHHREGGLWAINTGRSLEHMLEGLEQFGAPVEPDFLLTLEREIYCKAENGAWVAHGTWNARCEIRHKELFPRIL